MGLFDKLSKGKAKDTEKSDEADGLTREEQINIELNKHLNAFRKKDETAHLTATEEILALNEEHGSLVKALLARAFGYSDIEKGNISRNILNIIKKVGLPSSQEIEIVYNSMGPSKDIARKLVYQKKIVYLLAILKNEESYALFCDLFKKTEEPSIINFFGYAFKNFAEMAKEYLLNVSQEESFSQEHKKAVLIPLEALKEKEISKVIGAAEKDEEDFDSEILRKTLELPKETIDEIMDQS